MIIVVYMKKIKDKNKGTSEFMVFFFQRTKEEPIISFGEKNNRKRSGIIPSPFQKEVGDLCGSRKARKYKKGRI